MEFTSVAGNQAEEDFRQIGERFNKDKALVRLVDNQQLCSISGIKLHAPFRSVLSKFGLATTQRSLSDALNSMTYL